MHHFILVRQSDPEFSGSIGCCCRIAPGDVRWDLSGHKFPEDWEKKTGFGGLYRELKERFGEEVRLTVLDPRNLFAFIPLVVRDAKRFGVPFGEAWKAITSTSNATGVFDGRLVYQGCAPSNGDVIAVVESRLGSNARLRQRLEAGAKLRRYGRLSRSTGGAQPQAVTLDRARLSSDAPAPIMRQA